MDTRPSRIRPVAMDGSGYAGPDPPTAPLTVPPSTLIHQPTSYSGPPGNILQYCRPNDTRAHLGHRIKSRIDCWHVDTANPDRIPARVAEMIARAMPQPRKVEVIRARTMDASACSSHESRSYDRLGCPSGLVSPELRANAMKTGTSAVRGKPERRPHGLDLESSGGISPPGALRTVHDPLKSHGSRYSAVAKA